LLDESPISSANALTGLPRTSIACTATFNTTRQTDRPLARVLAGRDVKRLDCDLSLRNTFATLLLQANAPITYVSQQLGHRDPSIAFRVYAHYLPDASRRDVDRLDTQPFATPCNQGSLLLIRRRRLNRLE
jgi:integrase